MNQIKFITRYTQGFKRNLIYMVVATLVYVTVVLVNPLLLQFTIDNVINGDPITQPMWRAFAAFAGGVDFVKNNLWVIAIVIVGLNFVSGLALFIRGQSIGSFAETFTERLRNHLYDHLQTLPYAYHVRAKTGDLIQRCTSDVDTINRFLSNQIREFVYAILMVAISLTVMFNINVKMTFISMIVFPFIFLFGYLFFKKMQEVFRESDEAEAALSEVFQESLDAVRVVKAFNRERFELEKFTKKNKIYKDKTNHLIWLLGVYWGTSDLLCFLQILAVLIASIFEVRSGAMSVGSAVVFVSYISTVLWPIRNVGRILSDMGKVTVAIDRLNEILDVKEEDLDRGETPKIGGAIEFKNVTFIYDDGTDKVLDGVSFSVNPGETVAIMGPTGSGKSSLVHLLTRIYDVTEGEILFDGHNINTIAPRHVRQNVGIVLQEPYLFSKSIYENIKLATPHAGEREVYDAARVASIHDVISNFDQGYETLVGEKGVTLSGGQKQRVAIARTVINKQPIVVFDDSLSALDSETDATIRNELRTSNSDATTLIITHRVNSAQNADKIVVINEGKVAQIGTHSQLLQEEGLYRTIASIQNNQFGGDQ
ncbi:ABC transporter ATP-binding protein [Erysipelothrix sp. HDW6C]|uniref:ABC transporter ATP-binding protein n=1 Tax=Erysipelothrix sp. HDW6C TaxID=2714930 RepID=UPI00140C5CAE|nr:ABC transporter ATP-binding protein [Erysipelothrix sp. HDW6C]QIK70526.1 ABC transporter ATP-binding protein [Erysipelothrix sp. HDW6C]